jgi:5-methylcytosine-specific restriction endonuclease McrA
VPSLLDNQVLVLNRLWQPVNICSVRRAFSLLCLGHAQVVHTDEENNFSMHDMDSWLDQSESCLGSEVVRSISICLNVPRIIVLTFFDRLPKKDVKFTRHNVFERDKYTCQYCARPFEPKELNLDHVVPRDKGGKTTWENVVCSCIRCNSKKANKLPHEVNMFPMREPRAPRWRPFFAIAKASASHDSWRHFLKLDHQTVEVSD